MKEAEFYEKTENNEVRCRLCSHYCRIVEGRRGFCLVRKNESGVLYSLVYGRVIARHADPIEKKPLFHFYPGSSAYSIATPGCNFRCQWCQNVEIVELGKRMDNLNIMEIEPEDIIEEAEAKDCLTIAYTYTEPTVFFEYARDVAGLNKARGGYNVFVTNGFMTEEGLEEAAGFLDAVNVDLKSFKDETYRKYTGGRLKPVLKSLKKMKELGIWVEATTLIIPGINDEQDELEEMAGFIAEELGKETPWHITRFSPAHKLINVPPTPPATLERAFETGKRLGLKYVYKGNILSEINTYCSECGKLLIKRGWSSVTENRINENGACPHCGETIAGVGMGKNSKVDRTQVTFDSKKSTQ